MEKTMNLNEQDLVYRLRKRAEIRRQIPDRRSVQEGRPDRIADLLEEAADEIERLRNQKSSWPCTKLVLQYVFNPQSFGYERI